MNSKPPSSAVRATTARSAPSRGGPSGVVKSGICRPIFTSVTSRAYPFTTPGSSCRRPVALVEGLQRPQERRAITGGQGGENLLLAAPDGGLHGLPQPVAARG